MSNFKSIASPAPRNIQRPQKFKVNMDCNLHAALFRNSCITVRLSSHFFIFGTLILQCIQVVSLSRDESRNSKVGPDGERGARVYNGGLRAEPPAGSRRRAHGQGAESESLLAFRCQKEGKIWLFGRISQYFSKWFSKAFSITKT